MRYTKGIILKLLNVTLFTAMSLLSVYLSEGLHTLQVFWLISMIALIGLLPIVLYSKQPLHMAESRHAIFLLRVIFNVLGMCAWLEAISHIGPNSSSAISYMIPIFTTILAVLVCRESINLSCIAAIALSFIGLFMVLGPQGEEMFTYGGMMGLCAVAMWASHDIVCKLQTRKEHALVQAVYVFVFSAVLSGPAALLLWQPIVGKDLLIVTAMGIIAACNVVVVFMAYRAAPITVLMPFSYCRFPLMAILSYLILDEPLAPSIIYGVLVITLASSFIFYQQHMGRIAITLK